jgi:Tfp pilus assembly protein PilX
MRSLRLVLADRRRSQRGSVLSGVLIITAFLAIISGALMTSLSTNLLLSRNLVNRVASEATVNSAMELAFDSIQNAPLSSACPSLATTPSLNGRTASVTYLSCALVGSTTAIPTPAAVNVDGTYVPAGLTSWQSSEYLVADSAGKLHGYPFGQSTGWTYSTGGTPTAPPLAMSDGSGGISDLVPVSYSNPARHAVTLALETTLGTGPTFACDMAVDGTVLSRPAASRNPQSFAYVGDSVGTLFAFDAEASGACAEKVEATVPGSQPIVAGPIVFPGATSSNDRLFLIASDMSSSALLQYRYNGADHKLTLLSTVPLPAARAVGMAADTNSLPARLAITFSDGQVALVQVSSSFAMSLTAQSAGVPGGGVAKAPVWCTSSQCLGNGEIGVGSQGGLYVFDSNLNLYASFAGIAMSTSPVVDSGGDWFAGGTNGAVDELRPGSQGQMTLAQTFATASPAISSSLVIHSCATGLCLYFAASDPNAYLVSLDARDAVLSACLTNAQGSSACSGANPRLWADVEIGTPGNPQAVHVVGFSYYSP